MADDVMIKIIQNNPVKFGTAVVTWGNKNGDFKTTDVGIITNDNITASGTDVIWHAKLDDRFDDPSYYHGA